MKISVAMCTYNGAKYLPEQLASISAQNRLPDELVVCDDCSVDNTVEIVQNFALTAPFDVRIYVNEFNLRSTKNFEKAISLCNGDIIALSDQDDVWLPEKLQLFETEFSKNSNTGLVFCDGDIVDENLKSLGITTWQVKKFVNKRYENFISGHAFEELRKGNFVSGCMMAFHSRYKKLILPIPTNLPYVLHDCWIALILTTCSSAVPVSLPLVKYRQHSEQQLGANLPVQHEQTEKKFINDRFQFKPDYNGMLQQTSAIQKRLISFSDQFSCQNALSELNQYITHMQARTFVKNKNVIARAPTVFRELTALRYHRYSNGARSAIKDLML